MKRRAENTLATIADALASDRGDDQRRIAETGVRWLEMLLAKNADYGGSAWREPILRPGLTAGDAILVRMSDKVERIRGLLSKSGNAAVADESLGDTLADLGAYCLLYLARPDADARPPAKADDASNSDARPMNLVYVAGPYRAATEFEVTQNIRRAESLALKVWLAGAACICPHLNTAHFGGAAPDEVWLTGELEIVRRCDAVVLVEGWERSEGVRREVETARAAGIPVFERFEDFQTWLGGENERADGKTAAVA